MDPIRLRGPADVLAALPYQLGYHPRDCLVLVALHGTRVGLVARVDLPGAVAPEELRSAAVATTGPLLRDRPDSVLLVCYESDEGGSRPLADAVDDCVRSGGLPVADRLVVRQGRWYSVGCEDPDCCPEGGTPVPEPSSTPAVAEFVALGLAPLPDREALGALVAADAEGSHAVVRELRRRATPGGAAFGLTPARVEQDPADRAQQLAVQRLRWLCIWSVVCDVGPGAAPVESLTPGEVAELVTSLEDLMVRDGLIAWLCPETLPLDELPDDLVDQLRSCMPARQGPEGSNHGRAGRTSGPDQSAWAQRRLLVRLEALARAVPDPHAAGVLTVAASVAWSGGDGTRARVALERALEYAPGYRLARLLDRMVGLGVRHGPPEPGAVRRRSAGR